MVIEIDPLLQIISFEVLIGSGNGDYELDTMFLNFKSYIVRFMSIKIKYVINLWLKTFNI